MRRAAHRPSYGTVFLPPHLMCLYRSSFARGRKSQGSRTSMMLKTIGLVAALFLASAAPALAQSACSEPIAPAPVDGNKATTAQMNAAHDDVVTFLKQSDDYQSCVLREVNEAKADALKNKKDVDPAVL